MKFCKQLAVLALCILFVRSTAAAEFYDAGGRSSEQSPAPATKLSAQSLQQLVAPIALYPDGLIAQVLAASTFPEQVVEADRWIEKHADLKGEKLGKEVDKQHWDPSVKALTQFPSVLQNMDKNLSWTSSLGDAYANQPQDLMNALQELREQARKAGHLSSNQQQTVSSQGSTVVIQPANPEVVYVPAYDPWLVYGYPIVAYPGWYPLPGIFFAGPDLFWGVGFGVGFFGGFGWGWGHWGYNWHGGSVVYNHNRYVSHSQTISNRGGPSRGNASHSARSAEGHSEFHGSSAFHGETGMHSGAFSGFGRGGDTRSFSFRGQSSFGGGFHGGGFHGGGRR
jgi:hypothetical protein